MHNYYERIVDFTHPMSNVFNRRTDLQIIQFFYDNYPNYQYALNYFWPIIE